MSFHAFGYLSVFIALISYGVYFPQILSGKVRPHAFSWLMWTLTDSIVFFAQVIKGAGAGAWVTGITTLACFCVFLLALFKGDRKFLSIDWMFLTSALVSLLLWRLTHDPTLSVVLLSITDTLAIVPTLRKSYEKPREESVSLFALSALKSIIALFALESLSVTTWLFPATLSLTNGIIVLTLLVRRRQISRLKETNV